VQDWVQLKVRLSEICNRAYDLKLILETNRDKFDWNRLLAARSEAEVDLVLGGKFDRAEELLLQKLGLLPSVLGDKQFPKKNRDAQEQFIADSLAASGRVSIQRSRDLVQRERSAGKKRGKILRREFYIECSCKYMKALLIAMLALDAEPGPTIWISFQGPRCEV
jgi:hypothetical protein